MSAVVRWLRLVALLLTVLTTQVGRVGVQLHVPTAWAQVTPASPTITVDFASPVIGLLSMSGFLLGVDPTAPPDNMIAPLQPKLWRVGNFYTPRPISVAGVVTQWDWRFLYDRLVRHGTRVEFLLSQTWGHPISDPPPPAPYENWANWESHVRRVAVENRGRNLMYDIWNEPDARDFWWGTREQFFETYLRAYRVLRQVLGPDVMIGGPSLAFSYNKDFITAFLNYCKANSCEVNFLSWHELNDRTTLPAVADHLVDARSSFLQNPEYASLRIREIHVNEVVGQIAKHLPGASLGYLYYLEKGRADGASKACWQDSKGTWECYNNTLDGLLTPQTFQPRSVWWAYKFYADGVSTRVTSTTTDGRVVALASSRSATSQTAQVLVAFFDRNYGVRNPAPVAVRLILNNLDRLDFLSGSEQVHLKLEKMPDTGESPLLQLVLVDERNVTVQNGSAQTVIDNVAVGEAYRITLSRP